MRFWCFNWGCADSNEELLERKNLVVRTQSKRRCIFPYTLVRPGNSCICGVPKASTISVICPRTRMNSFGHLIARACHRIVLFRQSSRVACSDFLAKTNRADVLENSCCSSRQAPGYLSAKTVKAKPKASPRSSTDWQLLGNMGTHYIGIPVPYSLQTTRKRPHPSVST